MEYFKVTAIKGHYGANNDNNLITFYYASKDIFSAMRSAKKQGGVKHSRLPLSCTRVSKEEYLSHCGISAYSN